MSVTQQTPYAPPRVILLSDELAFYITLLTQRAAGGIDFRTGSGRILRDLLLHWPVIDDCEDDALELCQRITDAVYPLAAALQAQGVDIEITLSSQPIAIAGPLDTLSTLLLFDSKNKQEIQHFISPDHPLPKGETLRLAKGIALLCCPLNYHYHTIKDDREPVDRPTTGIFELAQRQINALYDNPAFIEQDRRVVELVKKNLQFLPENILRAAAFLGSPQLSPAVADDLTGLPPQIRNLERALMNYATDINLSAALRGGLRRVAQTLRGSSPQTNFAESAHLETARHAIKTVETIKRTRSPNYRLLPKSTPVDSIGRLNRTVTALSPVAAHPLRHRVSEAPTISTIISENML